MKFPAVLMDRLLVAAFFVAIVSSSAAPIPLVDRADGWRYHKGSSAPQANWKTVADAGLDGTWLGPAPGGFGYGDSDDTTMLTDMMGAGGYPTLYIRRTFVVSAPYSATLHLILTADYDDAFVAYLDGVEIYRSALVPGAAGEPPSTSTATGTREASGGGTGAQPPLVFDAGAVGSRLPVGEHVLAVIGLNESTGSSDFSLIIDLDLNDPPIPPLVAAGATWRYFKGQTAPIANWQTVANAALPASWLSGPGGFGYGDSDDATVLSDMQGSYTTVYIRQGFNVPATFGTQDHAFLTVDFDDGFVAYLDGVEVARQLVPGTIFVEPANTATASTTHEASAGASGNAPLAIDLGPANALLPVGPHILALIGVNESAGSSDLSLIPNLTVMVPPPPPVGSITEDTTWTLAGSPYTATTDITVLSGVTLTIEPGVTVLFGAGRRMVVNGILIAEGTAEQPITFTRSGTSGTWGQLYFGANNTTSVVAHAVMSFFASSAIEAHDTSVHIDSITWLNSTAQVVDLHNSSLVLLNSLIPGGAGNEPVHFNGMPANGHALIKGCIFGAPQGYNDSIDFTGGNRPGPIGQFIDNVFLAAVDDCFDMDATDAHIEGNIFMNVLQDDERDSSSHPITTGEGNATSELVVCRNFFYNCEHTVLLKDNGAALIQNNTIVHLVTNSLARTDPAPAGQAIPPGILLFGEPWRGDPPGVGAHFEGNIAYDLHQTIQNDPFPLFNPALSFLAVSRSLIQGPTVWPGEGNLATDPLFANLAGPMTYQNIKANLMLLAGSPCIGTGPNGLDMGANVPSGATISGEPEGITSSRTATLTVAGPGIYAYRWKLNDGEWSAEVPLTNNVLITASLFANARPILLSGLADGDYAVSVIGKSSAGTWQSTNSPTVSKTWTVGPDLIQISGVSHDGLTFTLHFNAQAGRAYTVQHREFIDSGTWETLTTIPSAPFTGTIPITDTPATARSQFYRVTSP